MLAIATLAGCAERADNKAAQAPQEPSEPDDWFEGSRWVYLPEKRESPMVAFGPYATSWDFAIACDVSGRRLMFITQSVGEEDEGKVDRMTAADVKVALPTIFDPDGYGQTTSTIAIDHPFVRALEATNGKIRFALDGGGSSELPGSPIIPQVIARCREASGG